MEVMVESVAKSVTQTVWNLALNESSMGRSHPFSLEPVRSKYFKTEYGLLSSVPTTPTPPWLLSYLLAQG